MKKHRIIIGVFAMLIALFWGGFAPNARSSDESMITTGLSDALYGIPYMDNFSPRDPVALDTLPRGPNGGYLLGSGGYYGTLLSYCLNAGAYAPYEGDGYVYAPLKGPRADVIRKILRRSALHPEVPQEEIQTIIWSIEDGVPVAELPPERLCFLIRLLNEEEIAGIDNSTIDYALLERDCASIAEEAAPPPAPMTAEEAMREYRDNEYLSEEYRRQYEEMLESNVEKGLIPREVLEMYRLSMEYQELAGEGSVLEEEKLRELEAKADELTESARRMEEQYRDMLTSFTAQYEEIERAAVFFGRPPEDKDSRRISDRRWSYHPDGYYIRFDPEGYSETDVEIYVPGRLDVTRDERGRITSVRNGAGSGVMITYDDSREPFSAPGDPGLVGYPMASVVFDYAYPRKPGEQLHLTWETSAWTFAGVPKKKGSLKSDPSGFPGAKERYERLVEFRSDMDQLDEQFSPVGSLDGVMSLASLAEALGDAYGDLPVETFVEALGVPREDAVSLGHHGFLFVPVFIDGLEGWDRFPAIDMVMQQLFYEIAVREGAVTAGEPERTHASLVTDVLLVAAGDPKKASGPGTIEFDPSGIVAVPGNSNEQRLGMSVPPPAVAPTPPKPADNEKKCKRIKILKDKIEQLKKIRELYGEVGKTAKDWNELEKKVNEAFKKWLKERYPGQYPAGTDPKTKTYGGADPCKGEITGIVDLCEAPYNYPFPVCYYMTASSLEHEKTHLKDADNNPAERDTFCSNDSSLAKKQVDIAVKWEQHAYDVQIKYLEEILEDLESQLDEPCK